MKLLIEVEDEFIPSQEYFLSSVDNKKKFGVVFEIDSETAYFYAVKMSKRTKNLKEIFDACHIYNIKDLTDGDLKSKIRIDWSENYQYALLFINDYVHAVFDFKNKQGYCRTGFPNKTNKKNKWSRNEKLLEESFLDQFKDL